MGVRCAPMTDASQSVDFDRRPPVPVDEYRVIVKQVNVGYELVLALVHSFLRALRQDDLHVLVVGAGGGAETEWLLSNPGWRMTGVDPSRDMLALAQTRAEQLGVTDRVSLVQGTIHDIPAAARFDAATCLFVLHFLGDADKLELLREINARRRAAGPLLLAAGTSGELDPALRSDFVAAWQQYGELAGMPADRMAQVIGDLEARRERASTAQDTYVRLLHEAGFEHVASVLSVLAGRLSAWVAR
jgi:tRNA (cmo5U34)-methyltransferase